MKTKLLWFIFLGGMILTSCESKSNLEQLKADLETKKTEVSKLKVEIKEIEDQIKQLDTTNLVRTTAVNVQVMQKQRFQHYFTVNGSFEAVDYAVISPETSGQITELKVKEGDVVKKGQVLARLNTAIIENSIREAKTALSLVTTVYEKQKELWDKKIGSEMEYLKAKNDKQRLEDQIKTLESQLDMAIINSPINGVVDQIKVKEGELAMPGAPMMQIVNLESFYLNVDVAESYLPYLHQGDEVTVVLPSWANEEKSATIYRIASIINPENRSFKVMIKMENADGKIRPNMLAEVKFNDFTSDNALVVPALIVKKDFNGEYLFIVKEEDGQKVAKKVYVNTGKSIANTTMIDSGIEEGDQVIVNGYNQVVEGSLVTVK